MNQFSQQSTTYPGQGFQQQQQQYEPSGYVQSHYQGQLSQPTFNQQSSSIVGRPQGGYSGMQSGGFGGMQQAAPVSRMYTQPAVPNQSYMSHGQVQSHASSPATAFGNVGPVIAHVGYQAGTQQQYGGQHSLYQPSNIGYQQQAHAPMTGQNYGNMNASQSYGTPVHSQTPLSPVYQATHAYEQAGPVIAHFGGWQNNSQGGYQGGSR